SVLEHKEEVSTVRRMDPHEGACLYASKKSTVSNWLIPNKVLESAELEHKPSRSEGITVYG
ncbi:MAG: hypothetical protein K0Q73_9030, partial [Paenibacillus sp.]|nr:hypothetical protein [Paenibacillus sp.]